MKWRSHADIGAGADGYFQRAGEHVQALRRRCAKAWDLCELLPAGAAAGGARRAVCAGLSTADGMSTGSCRLFAEPMQGCRSGRVRAGTGFEIAWAPG